MPQKRNPTILNTLRLQASTVIGDAQTFTIQAHNVTPGMPDYKREQVQIALQEAITMFEDFATLLDNMVVHRSRALDEVNAEYSTTTELADVLQREADVPFRIGHHFVSELVSFGRANGLRPSEIAYAEAQRIYAESARKFKLHETELPLNEQRFRDALSPAGMIRASQGRGGPQPAEVARMLRNAGSSVAADRDWAQAKRMALTEAQAQLDAIFTKTRLS